MARITRRIALAAAAAFGVAALSAPAVAADKIRVGKAVPFAWTFTPIEVGIQQGLFAKQGLDVEVIGFAGDAKLQQGMAADGVDIGLGSGPGMAFPAKGAPVKGVAGMAGPTRSIVVAVQATSPFKTIDDLKGKNIGVTTVGSLTDWLIRRIAAAKGWKGADAPKPISVGGLDTTRAALKTGQIDAAMIATEVAYGLEELGEWRIVSGTADYVTHFHTHVIFGRNELIEKNPELLRRFLQGWFDTIAFMKANKARTVEITAKVLDLKPSVISRTYDEEIGMFSDDGRFDPEAIKVLKASYLEMGTLDREPRTEEMLTEAFVPIRPAPTN